MKILLILWIALAGLPIVQAVAKTTSLQGDLIFQNQKLNNLFRLSGLKDKLENVESVVRMSEDINEDALAASQAEFARRMMTHAYSHENFYQVQKQSFLKNYKPQYVHSVVQWFQSPLGKKILKLENEPYNPDSKPAMDLFVENLLDAPPSEERVFLVEEIERSLRTTDAVKTLYLGYVRLMYPFNKKNQGRKLGKMLRVWKESITEPMREIVLRSLLFSYKGLKDSELEKYDGFLTSKAGRWFSRETLKGFVNGVKKNLHQAGKVQSDLVREIESGGPEYPLLREIAMPGQRYLLIGKRDPFRPLLDGNGLVSFSDLGPKPKARLLGDELKNIPPIALPVLAKIKDQYPKLFRDLKRFERLVNDRAELEEMGEDEYTAAINNYRDVLERAAEINMDESPLQIEYGSLRMTGIIHKKSEAVAMFEVGSTGYAVRLGDQIGPVFGHVNKIQNEQVIVVEKFRDYLGNTLTNQKVIEFYQGTSIEGDAKL